MITINNRNEILTALTDMDQTNQNIYRVLQDLTRCEALFKESWISDSSNSKEKILKDLQNALSNLKNFSEACIGLADETRNYMNGLTKDI